MQRHRVKSASFGNSDRGDAARRKLLKAGLKIFSEVGYEAASTRSLAAAAAVNIAAIPYYFKSKEGFYLAVIDYIVGYYRDNIGGGLGRIREALRDEKMARAECQALLDGYMRLLIHFVLQEGKERSQISRIYLREQLDPTSGFGILYEGFIRDMHETLEALVGRIIGADPASPEAKIVVQTLLGQVAIFRSSREAVLHDMGWKDYGEKGVAEIERIVTAQVEAIMQSHQKKNGAPGR